LVIGAGKCSLPSPFQTLRAYCPWLISTGPVIVTASLTGDTPEVLLTGEVISPSYGSKEV